MLKMDKKKIEEILKSEKFQEVSAMFGYGHLKKDLFENMEAVIENFERFEAIKNSCLDFSDYVNEKIKGKSEKEASNFLLGINLYMYDTDKKNNGYISKYLSDNLEAMEMVLDSLKNIEK